MHVADQVVPRDSDRDGARHGDRARKDGHRAAADDDTIITATSGVATTATLPTQTVRVPARTVAKRVHVTFTLPRRVVRVRPHVFHVLAAAKLARKKVTVVAARSNRCPPGTVRYDGRCSAAARGKG